MMACTPISTCTKNVVCLIGNARKQMIIRVSDSLKLSRSYYCTLSKNPKLHYTATHTSESGTTKCTPCCHSLTFKSIVAPRRSRKRHINVSSGYESMSLSLLVPKRRETSKMKCNIGPFSWQQRSISAGLFLGLLVCSSTSQPSNAEAHEGNEKKEGSAADYSNKKKALTDYSVIGIPGDGRCLFRSVAHGACIRSGKPVPDEKLQRQLADELRASVADEFIKRREETEWFIEGEFDAYVSNMRKPHVWGGEPELLMASHVLKMPITVYIYDKDCGGLISIAEYGQEYDKENPIKVLYHGYGHYDALQVPGKGGPRPRL